MLKHLAAALLAVTGCATAETDGAFHFAGRLDAASDVTHVIAANPDGAERVAVEIAADGSFDLAVAPERAWVVTFADWTKIGRDMQVATLQENGLDAFVPHGAGTLDLGTLAITDGRAHGSAAWSDVLDALGIDDATATRMGRTDNLALRYANPDIDNDGTLDALQFGHNFELRIAGDYTVTTAGRAATIRDLVAGTFAEPGIRYAGTTIQAVVPRAMNVNMQSGTLRFDEPFYGTASPYAVAAGTPVGAPHVKLGQLDGTPMIGVVARAGENTPSGTYELGFANGRLTFSDVHVPGAPALESGRDYAVPFVHIQPSVAGCTVDCPIDGIAIDWRALAAGGWQPAAGQAAELELVVSVQGMRTYLSEDLAADQMSLAWTDMPVTHAGILKSELSYVQTSGICFVAVTYASPLGMRMTMSVANPECY